MQDLTQDHAYQNLLTQISGVYEQAKQKVFQYANHTLVETNWWTGHYIVEFEQQGNAKAKYGKAILENLAKDLSFKYGKGFSRSNLNYMRNLYLFYPICETLSHKLSWSHSKTTKHLVIVEGKQALTTSLKVAETFGKRHDLVLRDIENLFK